MIFRVSFYRKVEVVSGRAPRYMVDVEADTIEDANEKVAQPGVVIRAIYKAPRKTIRPEPSFVFETSSARNKWYSSHKTTHTERLCHECKENEVERYKRLCAECRKRRELAPKVCITCPNILTSTRRRYCDECSAKRKGTQEKEHREKRAKQTTLERIRTQVAWAKEQLNSGTLGSACKLSARFQGLRLPHVTNERNRCRACLQKFINVQTVYLANLLLEQSEQKELEAAFNNTLFPEKEHGHSHAAGA